MSENFISGNCNQSEKVYSEGEQKNAQVLFENLEWVNSDEAAFILRKSVGALRTAVCRGQIRATVYRRRLYFRRKYLISLLETSPTKGGF
jgi:hypothetical protein